MSVFINTVYTQTHGYDLIVERTPPDTEGDLHFGSDERATVNFAKPLILLKHILHYDVVARTAPLEVATPP